MTPGSLPLARVLLVDDHPAVRQGVALLLAAGRHMVCGEAQSREEALARLDADDIDLVLLDLSLDDASGLDLLPDLEERDIPALVYSMHEDPETIERAFRLGARGYVTKREDPMTLLAAVGDVLAGRRHVSPRAARILADKALVSDAGGDGGLLSDRERQILALMGQGDSSAEIASALSISARTVETYCARMVEKLGLPGMKALRKYAIANHRQP